MCHQNKLFAVTRLPPARSVISREIVVLGQVLKASHIQMNGQKIDSGQYCVFVICSFRIVVRDE